MGQAAFYVLAIALSAAFGLGGVILGLWFGVRQVERDEGKYQQVAEALQRVGSDQQRLRIDWGTTLESLEQLAAATETRRRRAAASESSLAKREAAEQSAPRELSPAEQRDEIRRRMKRVV